MPPGPPVQHPSPGEGLPSTRSGAGGRLPGYASRLPQATRREGHSWARFRGDTCGSGSPIPSSSVSPSSFPKHVWSRSIPGAGVGGQESARPAALSFGDTGAAAPTLLWGLILPWAQGQAI